MLCIQCFLIKRKKLFGRPNTCIFVIFVLFDIFIKIFHKLMVFSVSLVQWISLYEITSSVSQYVKRHGSNLCVSSWRNYVALEIASFMSEIFPGIINSFDDVLDSSQLGSGTIYTIHHAHALKLLTFKINTLPYRLFSIRMGW